MRSSVQVVNILPSHPCTASIDVAEPETTTLIPQASTRSPTINTLLKHVCIYIYIYIYICTEAFRRCVKAAVVLSLVALMAVAAWAFERSGFVGLGSGAATGSLGSMGSSASRFLRPCYYKERYIETGIIRNQR